MNGLKLLLPGLAVLAVAGCSGTPDNGYDKQFPGTNHAHLSTLEAGIWVDPEGCDHWIIDDGVEGYLTQRVDDYGKPICSGAAPPNSAVGPFKQGVEVGDLI